MVIPRPGLTNCEVGMGGVVRADGQLEDVYGSLDRFNSYPTLHRDLDSLLMCLADLMC